MPGRPERRPAGILLACAAMALVTGLIAFLTVGDSGPATAAGANRVEVDFDEWGLESDVAEVEAGKLTFVVNNVGKVDHELLVIKTDLPADELPQGISGPNPKFIGKLVLGKPHQHISTNDSYALVNREPDANTKDHILPGDTEAFDVDDVKPGNYVLYCNLPGHYNRGQYASLKVTAPAGSDTN